MDAASTEPPATSRTRSSRTRTKLPVKTVTDLANKGLDSVQIGKVVGAHSSTIRRFLDKIKPESQAVSEFKSGRADVLATLQAKNLTIQEKLLEKLEDDGLLATLTPSQISGLMFALNTQHGTLYDKERLETGQSTQNHSIVAKMLSSAVSDIYKPLKDKQSVVPAPQKGAGSSEAEQVAPQAVADSEAGGPGGTGEL
jgi:IS30 family transposase